MSVPPCDDGNGVADAGDGQTLLGGGGGEQRPGAAEENPLQLSLIESAQKVAAEGNGAASAAGTAGVDILYGIVENHRTAVGQLAAQVQLIAAGYFQKHFLAQLAQISGDDQIKVIGCPFHIFHMGFDGGKCRRGHGGPHVVGIGHAQIGDCADGAALDSGAGAGGADQCRAGAGYRPLGSGSPLPAVAQGEPVLPLRGGKMGGGLGHHLIRKTAAHHHGSDEQTLRHGGAGTVKPQMGDAGIAQAEGGADALVQKIPGQDQVEILLFHSGLFSQFFQRHLLHFFLCLFPGLLAEIRVLRCDVKCVGQRTLRLLLACHAGPVLDHRQLRQGKALASMFLMRQNNTFFADFS